MLGENEQKHAANEEVPLWSLSRARGEVARVKKLALTDKKNPFQLSEAQRINGSSPVL